MERSFLMFTGNLIPKEIKEDLMSIDGEIKKRDYYNEEKVTSTMSLSFNDPNEAKNAINEMNFGFERGILLHIHINTDKGKCNIYKYSQDIKKYRENPYDRAEDTEIIKRFTLPHIKSTYSFLYGDELPFLHFVDCRYSKEVEDFCESVCKN